MKRCPLMLLAAISVYVKLLLVTSEFGLDAFPWCIFAPFHNSFRSFDLREISVPGILLKVAPLKINTYNVGWIFIIVRHFDSITLFLHLSLDLDRF